MKFYFLAAGITVMAAACENSRKPAETTMVLKSDSTFVVQPELPVVKEEPATTIIPVEKKTVAAKKTAVTKSTTTTSTSTSESSNTAATKKGWSKTAKGAVIGGVVGAGTGAIVNKKKPGSRCSYRRCSWRRCRGCCRERDG